MIRTTISIAALAFFGEAKSSRQRVTDVCDSDKWEEIFPRRLTFYTYAGFLDAVDSYDSFCSGTDD